MSTIPQRLREIAKELQSEVLSPRSWSRADKLIEVAEELEAPAADAGRTGPWCCANGKASGVQVCATCAEATAGYSAAMSPKPEPATDSAVPVVAVTDEMVATYLRANDAYWTRVDGLPTALGEWRAGTPKEATRESLAAVLRDHLATVAALQARINALEARQKWTHVADGLPPKNTEVLICFGGQNTLVSTGQWTGSIHDVGGWCYPWENRGATDDGEDPIVTHWMDAPELPQPDTSKEAPCKS